MEQVRKFERELDGYNNVIFGREQSPVTTGVSTMYELAVAYYARAKEIEMYIENEIKDGKVIARIRSTTGGIPIGAIQLHLKYDKDILSYRDHNFNSGATDFNNVTEDFISFGSLKTEEGAINNQSIYEFVFDTLKPIDSSLGLILFETIEAVTTDNEQVNILIQ